MAAPWEKYKSFSSDSSGSPWLKYGSGGGEEPKKIDIGSADELVKQQFKPSAFESGIAGAGQGLLSNFYDEIISKVTGDKSSDTREMLKLTQEANPKSFLAGELGGTVAQASVPGLSTSKPIGLLSRLGKASALGGLAGLGASDKEDFGSTAKDVGLGVAGGAIGQGLGELGGKAISKLRGETNLPAVLGQSKEVGVAPLEGLGKSLSDKAEKRAIKASGGMLKDFRALDNKGRINELGRALLDENIVKPTSTLKTIAKDTKSVLEREGNKILKFENGLDAKFDDLVTSPIASELVTGKKVAQRIFDEVIAPNQGTAMEEALGPVMKEYERFLSKGDAPLKFAEARKLKKSLDRFIDFNKQQTPQKELVKQARRLLNNEIENSVGAIGEAAKVPALKEWKKAKQLFSVMMDANEMAEDKLFRNEANRLLSPSDYFSAGTGLLAGVASSDDPETALERGAKGALIGGAGNRLARMMGPQTTSYLYDKLAKSTKSGDRLIDKGLLKTKDALKSGIGARLGAEGLLRK